MAMSAKTFSRPKHCPACNKVVPGDTLFLWVAWFLGKGVDTTWNASCNNCIPRIAEPARTARNLKSGSTVTVVTKRRFRKPRIDGGSQ